MTAVTLLGLMDEWIKQLRTLPTYMLLYLYVCHWNSQISAYASRSLGTGLDGSSGATRGDTGVGVSGRDSGVTWPRFSGSSGGVDEANGVGTSGNNVMSDRISRVNGRGIGEPIRISRSLNGISAEGSFRRVDREIYDDDERSFGSGVGVSTGNAGSADGTGGIIIRPRYSDSGREVGGDNWGKAKRTRSPHYRIFLVSTMPNSVQDSIEDRMAQVREAGRRILGSGDPVLDEMARLNEVYWSKTTPKPPGSEVKEVLLWMILPLAMIFVVVFVWIRHREEQANEQRDNRHGRRDATTNSAINTRSRSSHLAKFFRTYLLSPVRGDSTAAPTSRLVQTRTRGEPDDPARGPGGSRAIPGRIENHSTVDCSDRRSSNCGSDDFIVAVVMPTPVTVDETASRIADMSPADSPIHNFNPDLPPSYEDAMGASDTINPPPYNSSLVSPDSRNIARYQTFSDAPSYGRTERAFHTRTE